MGDFREFVSSVAQTAKPLSDVPFASWALLAVGLSFAALVFYLGYYVLRWRRYRWLAKVGKFEDFKVTEATDNYIMVHGQDVASDMKSGTDVAVSVLTDKGVRRRKGTITRTYTYLQPREIRLPHSLLPVLFNATDEAGISQPQKLKIDKTERFLFERLWNHPRPDAQLQIRLAVYLTLITTIIGLLQGYVFEFWIIRN